MPLFARRAPSIPRRHARIGKPLTAAARQVDAKTGRSLKRLTQNWQLDALHYYNTVGECWYPAQFYARALTKVRLFPAMLDERGELQEIDSGPLVDLFERIQDPGGGRSELAGAYGRLMFLTGDGYLTVSEQDSEEAWEFLSPAELKVERDTAPGQPQRYRRLRAPGIEPEELAEAADADFEPLGNQARVYRLWRRHPMYSEWADSPIRAVLDLYALLVRLTAAAGAESTSRAASRGGFYLPDDLSFAELDAEGGGDEDSDIDIFMRDFTTLAARAIENPGAAEAMMPLVVRGPGGLANSQTGQMMPMKDALGYFQIGPERKYEEADMWEKTIQRINNGLDFPRDLARLGELNHWTAWIVDEQAFRAHLAPVAEKLCADLNAAYLRPAAMDAGVENADMVTIGYDPAEAINHPDEIKTAAEAWDRGIVSDDYYRDKIGATDDDAPDEEELERRLLWLAKKVEPDEDEEQEGETSPEEGGRGGDTDEQAPEIDESRRNGQGTEAQVAAARIGAAVELQIERARELAGNRLVRRSQGCESCREAIRGVPSTLVAATLGRKQVRSLIREHTTEAELVSGGGDALIATIRRWGLEPGIATTLCELVEKHALETLYERDVSINGALTAAVQRVLA